MDKFKLVDEMTSREFQNDLKAHVQNTAELIRNNHMMDFYKDCILTNRHLFKDRIVLNLSCGIGILSLFAAKAGAKQVYAVDDSNVLCYMHEIIKENNYEKVIKIIRGDIKTIELPVENVDIIISDWPGYSLYYQASYDEVVYARDKWLIKDGIIIPDSATLFFSFVKDKKHRFNHIEWWRNVYGFKMQSIGDCVLTQSAIYNVNKKNVVTAPYNIAELDMYTTKCDKLKFRTMFFKTPLEYDYVDGFITYFDIVFKRSHVEMKFLTNPWAQPTRFLQSVFFFDRSIRLRQDTLLFGAIEMTSDDMKLDDLKVRMELFQGHPRREYELELERVWYIGYKCLEKINMSKTASDEGFAN